MVHFTMELIGWKLYSSLDKIKIDSTFWKKNVRNYT